jgi:hypothetical protein
MSPANLPAMTMPSAGSTVAFVGVVFAVCAMFVWAVRHGSEDGTKRRNTILAGLGLGAVLAVTAVFAEAGVVADLAGSPALMLYLAPWNGLALIVALSPLGRSMARHVPIAALVGFQGFRLPLELVLHRWYQEGALPVQMTYSGHNLDIATGILALVLAIALNYRKLPPSVLWGFNLLGLTLLVAVVHIAVRSSPVPFRTYLNEPAVQLAFHAPYTWIVPICVAGALFGHVVTIRALLRSRSSSPSPQP